MVRFIIWLAVMGVLALIDWAVKRSTDRMIKDFVRKNRKD